MLRTLALSTSLSLALSLTAAATEPTPTTPTPTKTEPAPNWQLGVDISRILSLGPNEFASLGVGVERRLTDSVWLTVDARGGVQVFDTANDGNADGVADGTDSVVFGGGDVGARWFVVNDGFVRPSLRGAAGLTVVSSGVKSEVVDAHSFFTRAGVTGGVDVDIVLDDNVSLRLGTTLLRANVTRSEPDGADLGTTAVDVGVGFDPGLALQVFF